MGEARLWSMECQVAHPLKNTTTYRAAVAKLRHCAPRVHGIAGYLSAAHDPFGLPQVRIVDKASREPQKMGGKGSK